MKHKRRELPTKLAPEKVKAIRITHQGDLDPGGRFYRIQLSCLHDDTFVVHLVTLGPQHLHLTFGGGWGPWSYEWFHTGGTSMPAGGLGFAVQIGTDCHYLLRKMAQGRLDECVDTDGTEEAIKFRICQRRLDDEIDRETARDAWNDLSDIDCGNRYEVHEYMTRQSDALGDEWWELMHFQPPQDVVIACLVLYPVVADFIRDTILRNPQQTIEGLGG